MHIGTPDATTQKTDLPNPWHRLRLHTSNARCLERHITLVEMLHNDTATIQTRHNSTAKAHAFRNMSRECSMVKKVSELASLASRRRLTCLFVPLFCGCGASLASRSLFSSVRCGCGAERSSHRACKRNQLSLWEYPQHDGPS